MVVKNKGELLCKGLQGKQCRVVQSGSAVHEHQRIALPDYLHKQRHVTNQDGRHYFSSKIRRAKMRVTFSVCEQSAASTRYAKTSTFPPSCHRREQSNTYRD